MKNLWVIISGRRFSSACTETDILSAFSQNIDSVVGFTKFGDDNSAVSSGYVSNQVHVELGLLGAIVGRIKL